MSTVNYTAPGVYTGRSMAERALFYSGTPRYLPSFHFISGDTRDTTNDNPHVLRAGLMLGKIIASPNYYTNAYNGFITANAAASATSITVGLTDAAEISRLKTAAGGGNYVTTLYGPPTAAGTVASQTLTVTAVNTSTGVLTVSALSAAAVSGSLVGKTGVGPPSQFVSDPYGIDIYDRFAAGPIDQTLRLIRDADINVQAIVGYATLDVSVQAGLKAIIRANNGGLITFSDDR